jgi:hypothetical protein
MISVLARCMLQEDRKDPRPDKQQPASNHMKKLLLLSIAAFSVSLSAYGDAIIRSGDIVLGINDEGHLNVPDVYSLTSNSTATGVTVIGVGDATSPGCLCEGWGVSGSGLRGFANVATDGVVNLVPISFLTDDVGTGPGTFATSTVGIGGSPLVVTQAYAASTAAPGSLFENKVTITNTGATSVTDVRYVRVMDWDVPPTEFSELVTIRGTGTTTNLELSHNNGFATANPLAATSALSAGTTDVDFEDFGPLDHGAYFKFNFGTLAAGESKEFSIFYGGAPNEALALSALGAVGAELFSFGQNSTPGHDSQTTFIFAFKGVGGEIIVPPGSAVPDGGHSAVLLALSLPALAGLRWVTSRCQECLAG